VHHMSSCVAHVNRITRLGHEYVRTYSWASQNGERGYSERGYDSSTTWIVVHP